MLEQPALADAADERDCGATGYFRMSVAVAQRHHLAQKFDVDQTATTLLDVETSASIGAKFTLDAQAHRGYLGDFRAAESAAEYELPSCRLDLRAQFGFAREDARAHQCLALPHGRRTITM